MDHSSSHKGIHVDRSITVNRPPDEVYRFWHNFENLPLFMRHLEAVRSDGNGRSHWKAKAPAGMTVEWDAEIVEDVPNEIISWQSLEGSEVNNSGTVRLRPAPRGRGTEIHVHVDYEPPGGRVTAALAQLFREEPGQQIQDDLYAFKQVMETGEVLMSDASLIGEPHPAQPPSPEELQQRER